MSADDRKARLAAELRMNLARRKARPLSHRTGGADQRPEGLGGAGPADGETMRNATDDDAGGDPSL